MSQLKRKIMRRVYFIWFARTAASPASLKVAAILVLLWQFMVHVSIADVVANSPLLSGDVSAIYAFFGSALANTEMMTIFLMAGLPAVFVWTLHDILRHRGGQLSYSGMF